MRTIALILAMGIAGAAETPKTQPASTPVAPKSAPLSEVQQERVEKFQALIRVKQLEEAEAQTGLRAVIDGACRDLGGAAAEDCTFMPPQRPGDRYTVTRRPVQPPPATPAPAAPAPAAPKGEK